MAPLRILGLSGNVTQPSRTAALVASVVERLAELTGGEGDLVELADAAPHILTALTRATVGEKGEAILRRVETADLLVVGSPVYRASYTGALKHLFDLVDFNALAGKPAILAATGGSPLHGLVTDHQLRPLLSFFRALTLPTTLYAVEADFTDYRLNSPAIAARIERAAQEAALFLTGTPARAAQPVAVALHR
ncbi:FMN reductase [Aureimonas sp. AU40]|uniref:FMN reductase n=1 Tax=Aureimonas sp. AU40 TaxID=1637747 RepID=UPI000780D076|nr:FMN reductase [Aureimonas sp. AU40]